MNIDIGVIESEVNIGSNGKQTFKMIHEWKFHLKTGEKSLDGKLDSYSFDHPS